jgi:hypothetical protein
MKSVLFRVLVLVLGGIVLLAQTDSFAARGGGRGGGGGRAVSRGGGGGRSYNRSGGMGGGARRSVSSRPSVSGGGYRGGTSYRGGGGQARTAQRPGSNRAGGLAPNKNIAGGNINRSQVSSKIQSRPWKIGTNNTVLETGLQNLSEDVASCLVHFGPDKTQTWLLVRQKQPEMPNAPQTAEVETKGS